MSDVAATNPGGTPDLDPELRDWLAAHAVAADPDEALPAGALHRMLAGVRVLGLAPTISGTHDLAGLGQRIVEHLVAEHGVTVLAVDLSASTTTVLDAHVRHGDGTGLEVVDRLGTMSWRTREGLGLIEALRRYDDDHPEPEQVRVVGLDPTLPAYSVRVVGEVLREVDQDTLDRVAPDLADLVQGGHPRAGAVAAVDTVIARLGQPASPDADTVGPERLAAARHHAHLLRRAVAHAVAGADAPAERERLMAEAVGELVEAAGPDGPPIVVWGHADHLLVGDDPVPTLGHHLRAALGDGYYALGLLAGAGAFRALKQRRFRKTTRSLVLHRLSPTPGIAADLVAATPSGHVVDLRGARDDAPAAVTGWLDGSRPVRVLGEVIRGSADRAPQGAVSPGGAADGWAAVARVWPAGPR